MHTPEHETNSSLGQRLLRIAVVADTHLTEADGVCNSPFPVNKLANDRLRFVIHSLNQAEPDFTIHLGDIVHPVPAVPDLYEQAVTCFREQVADLQSDMLLVPGNHDVGDKPIDWGPAGVICEEYVELWDRYFGPNYTAVEREGCHFIVLNAQLINTGFESETRQRQWLEGYLQEHEGGRFFVSLHYPPYLLDADEREHYDNLAEPGRSWLLELLERHKVEALFAGHVHHFWTYRHDKTQCYLLPSTAFVRQDYSEMFRAVPPADTEFGRNDLQKLGYLLLEVYEHGHLCRPVRTEGQMVDSDSTPSLPPALRLPFPPHPKEESAIGPGFDMRKDWLAPIEIPPSGGLDEFDRKSVRNDYPIMALWEMGIRRLRIPRADLDEPDQTARLRGLHAQGMRFTLFTYDVPDSSLVSLVGCHSDLLEAWEIAVPVGKVSSLVDAIEPVVKWGGPDIYLSKLRGKDDVEKHSGTYYHVINHGFAVEDIATLRDIFADEPVREAIHGVVCRVGCEQAVSEAVAAAQMTARELNLAVSVHVRMGSENPAEARWDEMWASNRATEVMALAHTYPSLRLFIDTLADVDRGYFPRMGVLDALWNPRIGFHAVRNLHGILAAGQDVLDLKGTYTVEGARCVVFESCRRWFCLLLPDGSSNVVTLPSEFIPPTQASLTVWDLGKTQPVESFDIEALPRRDTPWLLSC